MTARFPAAAARIFRPSFGSRASGASRTPRGRHGMPPDERAVASSTRGAPGTRARARGALARSSRGGRRPTSPRRAGGRGRSGPGAGAAARREEPRDHLGLGLPRLRRRRHRDARRLVEREDVRALEEDHPRSVPRGAQRWFERTTFPSGPVVLFTGFFFFVFFGAFAAVAGFAAAFFFETSERGEPVTVGEGATETPGPGRRPPAGPSGALVGTGGRGVHVDRPVLLVRERRDDGLLLRRHDDSGGRRRFRSRVVLLGEQRPGGQREHEEDPESSYLSLDAEYLEDPVLERPELRGPRVARARKRVVEDRRKRRRAPRHDGDPPRQLQRLLHVVRHEETGLPGLLPDPRDLAPHLEPREGVEGAERLVQVEDVRVDRERPGELDALLHPARELRRVRRLEAVEPDERHVPRDDLAPLLSRPVREPESDVVAHREPRKDAGLLEDEDSLLRRARHALAVDLDRPRRRLLEAGDAVQERRLAAPRRPDDGEELLGRDVEVDAGEDLDRLLPLPEGLRDAGDADLRGGAAHARPAPRRLSSKRSSPRIRASSPMPMIPMTTIAATTRS